MLNLRVLPLADAELTEAYPLVRSTTHIELDRWLTFARELVAIDGGVLGARADDGCLYGVATFVPLPGLREERVLLGGVVAAIELGRASRVRPALCEALQEVASAFECNELVAIDHGSARSLMAVHTGAIRLSRDGCLAPIRGRRR